MPTTRPTAIFGPYTPHHDRRPDGSELVSYRTLRRVVGVLGVALPVVVAGWGFVIKGWWQFQPTISDYYAIRPRDAFVGILFTVGWFLFTYRGFDWRDELAGNVACVLALGVALLPVTGPATAPYHYLCAGGLFLTLAFFSFYLFTRSSGTRTEQKRKRDIVYRVCGVTIALCIAIIGLFDSTLHQMAWLGVPAIFALETVALWAFGFSWFVKGETVLRDRQP